MTEKTYTKINHDNIVLHIGTDGFGRIQSRIVKNGRVVAVDIYVRMPNYDELTKQGWKQKP